MGIRITGGGKWWRAGALLVALVVTGVTGCGDVAGPSGLEPLEGAWAGEVATPQVHLAFTLREQLASPGRTAIDGEGELSGAGPTTPTTVTGVRRGTDVELTIEPHGFMAIQFTGSLTSSGSLEGVLLGSGIVNLPIVLARADSTH